MKERWKQSASVLVTRPVHQAQPLVEKLESAGFGVNAMPMLAIRPYTLDELSSQSLAIINAIQQPGKDALDVTSLGQGSGQSAIYDKIIFVSANAVSNCSRLLVGKTLFDEVGCIGMGRASCEAIERQGWKLDPMHHDPEPESWAVSSETLIQSAWSQDVADKRFLICRGRGGVTLLGDTLRSRGADVDYLEVYERETCRYPLADLQQLAGWINAEVPALKYVLLGSVQTAVFFIEQLALALSNISKPEAVNGVVNRVLQSETALVVPSSRAAAIIEKLLKEQGEVSSLLSRLIVAESASDQAMTNALLDHENGNPKI